MLASMTHLPPEPDAPQAPDLDRESADALIAYAEAQSEYWRWHIDLARTLGKKPGEQAVLNVAGWAFVATALAESYDGVSD